MKCAAKEKHRIPYSKSFIKSINKIHNLCLKVSHEGKYYMLPSCSVPKLRTRPLTLYILHVMQNTNFFELSCSQTDRQTDRQRDSHQDRQLDSKTDKRSN